MTTPTDALDAIRALIAADDSGDTLMLVRDALIELDEPNRFDTLSSLMTALLTTMLDSRECLTQLALDLSLCPMHLCDYAICFDDENDQCADIRFIHPEHDT